MHLSKPSRTVFRRGLCVVALVIAVVLGAGFGPSPQTGPTPLPPPAAPAKIASSLAQRVATGTDNQAEVRVIIEAEGSAAAAIAAVHEHGGRFEQSFERLVQALIPIAALPALAADPRVRYVRPPLEPISTAVTDPAVESTGALLIGVPEWHRNGFTGRGVRIAVLDTGFDNYQALIGRELPTNTIVRSFRADNELGGKGNDNHGTASAEIIYDIAPEAQLYLVNFGTEVELGNAVDYLIQEKVDIVSFSVGFLTSGPGDGTGIVNEIVTRGARAGLLWVVAAGNHAQRHWMGPWLDPAGDGILNFAPGVQSNTLYAAAGDTISVELRWNDPWGASCNDYNMGLYDVGFRLVAASNNEQSCRQDPVERITYTTTQGGLHYVVVQRYRADGQSSFHLFSRNQNFFIFTPESSLTQPGDNPYVVTVGAVDVEDGTTLEGYSSRGPTTDGRIKPDLVAPDRVATVSRPRFLGTSAATPHVAAAAALVKQAGPGLTNAQLKTFLLTHTVALSEQRPDNNAGWGRLRLGPAPRQGPASAPITEQLASIQGKYRAVFGYIPGLTGSSWQAYSPTAPPQANDLTELRVGFGYWINATEAATLMYGGHIWQLLPGWNLIGWY